MAQGGGAGLGFAVRLSTMRVCGCCLCVDMRMCTCVSRRLPAALSRGKCTACAGGCMRLHAGRPDAIRHCTCGALVGDDVVVCDGRWRMCCPFHSAVVGIEATLPHLSKQQ